MAESQSAPAVCIPVYGEPSLSASTSSGSAAAYVSHETSRVQDDEGTTARYPEGLLAQHIVANTAAGNVSALSFRLIVQQRA